MAQVQGSNCKLIFAEETTFGVTPTTPAATNVNFKDEGFQADTELLKSEVLGGDRNSKMAMAGKVTVKGSFSTELNPTHGTFLKHLIGTVTTTGASAPYTHVIKVGALPESMCFEKAFPDLDTPQYFLYNGMRINKGSFDFKPAGPVAASFDLAGRERTISGTSIDETPTDNGHNPFTGFEAELQEGGVSIGIVTALKFDIDNDLQTDLYVIGGGGKVHSIPAGKNKVSGTMTTIFADMGTLNKAIAKTESSLKITLTHGTGAGTTGNESIEFFIPELKLKESDPVIKDAKGIMLEVPFEAYYNDSASASTIVVTIKNTLATI